MKHLQYRLYFYTLTSVLLLSIFLAKKYLPKTFVLPSNTSDMQTLAKVTNLKLVSVNCSNKDTPVATFTWDSLPGANYYGFYYKNTLSSIQTYETQATTYNTTLVPNADSKVAVFGLFKETVNGVTKTTAKSQESTSLFVSAQDIANRCGYPYISPAVTKSPKPTISVKPTSTQTQLEKNLEEQIKIELEKELEMATGETIPETPTPEIKQNIIQRLVAKIMSLFSGVFSKK